MYPFIEAEKAEQHNVAKACELLEVSRSAFYGWHQHPPSARQLADEQLGERIEAIFDASRGTYGWPRVHRALRDEGVHASRKRVARIMRQKGLIGRCRRRWTKTTISDPETSAVDLLKRAFGPGTVELDRVYVSDITYIWTWEGWLYLATVIDLASRRVVGWSMAELAGALPARSWNSQRSSRAQTRGQLATQSASALHVQRLIDRLMRDPHGPIIGEVDAEPVRYLLGAPRPGPSPVSSSAVTSPNETHSRASHKLTIGPGDRARKTVLYVLAQPVIGGKLGHLRPARPLLGVPLRGRRPIRRSISPGRRVTAQLSRDRRRRPVYPPSDLADTELLLDQDRDLLPLRQRQVPVRGRLHRDRRHAASLTEPPGPNRG